MAQKKCFGKERRAVHYSVDDFAVATSHFMHSRCAKHPDTYAEGSYTIRGFFKLRSGLPTRKLCEAKNSVTHDTASCRRVGFTHCALGALQSLLNGLSLETSAAQ